MPVRPHLLLGLAQERAGDTGSSVRGRHVDLLDLVVDNEDEATIAPSTTATVSRLPLHCAGANDSSVRASTSSSGTEPEVSVLPPRRQISAVALASRSVPRRSITFFSPHQRATLLLLGFSRPS